MGAPSTLVAGVKEASNNSWMADDRWRHLAAPKVHLELTHRPPTTVVLSDQPHALELGDNLARSSVEPWSTTIISSARLFFASTVLIASAKKHA
jgi:hypothetical protein